MGYKSLLLLKILCCYINVTVSADKTLEHVHFQQKLKTNAQMSTDPNIHIWGEKLFLNKIKYFGSIDLHILLLT